MADFKIAIERTLKFEGGYSNDRYDYGGETRYGISKRSYPELDIKNLTLDDARAIYKRDYWDKLRLDEVKSQAVAEELLDTAVNMGWKRAAEFLQEALNLLEDDPDKRLKLDGLIGTKTLQALIKWTHFGNTKIREAVLVKLLNGFQLDHYVGLARKDPRQRRFLVGWIHQRVEFKEA